MMPPRTISSRVAQSIGRKIGFVQQRLRVRRLCGPEEGMVTDLRALIQDLERYVAIRVYLDERLARRRLVRAECVDGTVAMIPADEITF